MCLCLGLVGLFDVFVISVWGLDGFVGGCLLYLVAFYCWLLGNRLFICVIAGCWV